MKWLLLSLALASAGCLSTSPEDAARAALGPGDGDDGDEEHRPGQPCLTCHRDGYSPGDDKFVVAGTVYLRASDSRGLRGASVEISDAAGHQFTAQTNDAGNFMVEVREGISAPRTDDEGKLRIPWRPVFPLQVSIRHGDVVKEMKSHVWRDGSCAGCHVGSSDTVDKVAKIWLIEEGN